MRQRLDRQQAALVLLPAFRGGAALLFGDDEPVGGQIRKDDGENLLDGRDVAGQREIDRQNRRERKATVGEEKHLGVIDVADQRRDLWIQQPPAFSRVIVWGGE